MDITKTITHISLCAGYGGIDLGLRRAIPSLRTIAFSEIECFACANLVSKMEAGLLDASPIWTDVKTFPWKEFSGRVDILSGGYPCQPFSAAGKRLGTDDSRHLWPFIANGIRILQPQFCFFENVEGHITLGLREVISELESMGYKVSWGIFSAREVGAPHQRKRVFILAMANSTSDRFAGGLLNGETIKQTQRNTIKGSSSWPSRPNQPQHGWEPPRVMGNSSINGLSQYSEETRGQESCGEQGGVLQSEGASPQLGNSEEQGFGRLDARQEKNRKGGNGRHLIGSSEIMGDTSSLGSHRRGANGNWEQPKMFGARLEHMGNAEGGMPRQSKTGHWREGVGGASEGRQLGNAEEQGCGRLDDESGEIGGREPRGHADWSSNPEQQEQWQAESTMGRNAYGTSHWMDYAELSVSCDNRIDELRLLGNGVVPATATLAFQTLLAELLHTQGNL